MNLLNQVALDEIKNVSKLVDDGLSKRISYTSPKSNTVFAKIASQDLKTLHSCLGDFGVRAKHFCDFYDILHPCVIEKTKILEKSRLGMEISETIDIAGIAKSNLLSMLCEIFNDNRILRNLMTNFANMPIRAIKNKENRISARENGATNLDTDIDSSKIETAFQDIRITPAEWTLQTETSFAYYARLNEVPNENESKYKIAINFLNEMGMSHQANGYKARLEEIKFYNKNIYCGFKPIQLTNAACILGKIHQYCYDKVSKIGVSGLDIKINALFDFLLPGPPLLKLISPVALNREATISELLQNNKGSIAFYEEVRGDYGYLFSYQPRLYSIQCFKSLIPDRIVQLINSLDSFEDFGGFPVFDKYFILMPGISFNEIFFLQPSLKFKFIDSNNKNEASFKFKTNKRIIDSNNKSEAYYIVDSYLLVNKLIYPIVLGQKDNLFYFLDYLN